jgi:hypothetical protein
VLRQQWCCRRRLKKRTGRCCNKFDLTEKLPGIGSFFLGA